MSIQPALGSGSVGTSAGLASAIADLRRQLAQLSANRTKIGDGTLTGTQIAAGTITGDNIEAGSITTGTLAAGSITTELIAAGAIVAGLIAAGAVTTDALAALSVTAEKIDAGAITAGKIAAGAITAGTIAAGAIQTNDLAAGSITSDKILSGAVTSDKITVTALSAITTNMGNITAGTVTGATIQTAGSGSRVVMDSLGLHGYGIDGVTKVFDIDSGSGIATLTGVIQADPSSVIPTVGLSGPLGGYNLFSNTSFEVEPGTDSTVDNNFRNPEILLWSMDTGGRDASLGDIPHGSWAFKGHFTNEDGPTGQFINDAEKIDVVAGETYCFSAYVRTDSATASDASVGPRSFAGGPPYEGILGVDYFPVAGFHTGPLPQNEWVRMAYRWVVPADGTYTNTGWRINVVDTSLDANFWIDGVQLEKGSFPTAYAPKSDEILPGIVTGTEIAAGTITANNIQAGAIEASLVNVDFNGPNLLLNAGFEYGVYDGGVYSTAMEHWAAGPDPTSVAAVTEQAWEGSQSAKVTGKGATGPEETYLWNDPDPVPVYEGEPYTASVWVMGNLASVGVEVTLSLLAYSGTDVGTFVASVDSAPFTLTADWQEVRLGDPWVIPAGANYVRARIQATGGLGTGDSFYVDGFQVAKGSLYAPYAPKNGDYIPGSVGSTVIAPNSITTDQILVNSIQADRIVTGSITASKIASGAITAGKIDALAINGMTITGATIQTDFTGQRVQLDVNGLTTYDDDGNETVSIFPSTGTGAIDISAAPAPDAYVDRKIRFLSNGLPTGWVESWAPSSQNLVALVAKGTSTKAPQIYVNASIDGFSGGKGTGIFCFTSKSTDGGNSLVAITYNAAGTVSNQAAIVNGVGGSSFVRAQSGFSKIGQGYGKLGFVQPADSGSFTVPAGGNAILTLNHGVVSSFGAVSYQIIGGITGLGNASLLTWSWAGVVGDGDSAQAQIHNSTSVGIACGFRWTVLYWG